MKLFRTIWAVILFSLVLLLTKSEIVLASPPANFQTTPIVASGLNGPSGFEIAPDGRIFVLERTGKIKIIKNGVLLDTPFADLPSVASGDRGLIGIAIDPEFGVSNHYVYFYYTGTDLLNRLVRFDASTDVGTNGPFVLYQTNSPSQELHVGGSIGFGLDGKLYFAVGDNGYPPNAQNLSNPHGKLLRINKDGSIPIDNPFFGQPGALPEIWAYGMRNPWRFQFDSVTGYLYDGDVGDFTWEEINKIEKGKNYGWPTYEGMCVISCGNVVNPIYAYNHDGESAAVTGGPVYRGDMFPQDYDGSLFFGDYAKGFIKRSTLDAFGNSTGIFDFDLNAGSVVDLKVAPDGSLYYITYYPGRLYQITYTTGNHKPIANATADNEKGIEPHTVTFSSAGSSDPDNDPITYLWDFGDGTTSTEANPTHTYVNKGTYTVELFVSDGPNTSNAVPIVIQVGIPPTVNIGEPSDGSTYKAGDTIHWTASALDGAGFDINDSDIKTEILLHHGTHIHPFLGPIVGRQGQFTVPTTGEASPDTWFEIKVTATDTNGLFTTESVFVYPLKSQLTFATTPPGLQILLDGSPITTPKTIEGVVNFQREVSAQTIQELNGQFYQFDHWSDNGAPRHTITIEQTVTTYTAFFTQAQGYEAEYFNNTELQGTPALTRQDAKIDFVWGGGSPDPLIQDDNFSVRWIKNQYFAAGSYKFTTATDDGVRLFIDGNPIINEWHGNNASFNATVDLTAGIHEIKMEYFEGAGLANARLEYDLAQNQSPPPPPSVGYAAEYYANKTLTGEPAVTRTDPAIDFDWGGSSPDPAIIPADNFSARWTKTVDFVTGTYEFTATADDGVRVVVDGEIIIDKWIDQAPTTYKAQKVLAAGSHTIVMEYYENGGGAVAKLSYVKLSDTPPPSGTFSGEYFNNKTLTGAPVLSRSDALVNFDWGSGAPDPSVPADNFSARWTKTETFVDGTYEFTVTGDDGVRLYVDNELILDKWIDQAPTTFKISKAMLAGDHIIKFEYYENGGGAVAKLSYQTDVTPPPPPTGSFTAEYFNNKDLLAPVVLTRQDNTIDFDWGGGSPDGLINANNFSARWTKTDTFVDGTYEFVVIADDGIRVKLDGVLILDKWIDQAPTTYTIQSPVTAGDHTIVVEYYENGGGAVAKLSYNLVGNPPPPPPTGTYQAKYWNFAPGTAPVIPLSQPVLTREDAEINFDWQEVSPGPQVNANQFIVQWLRTYTFEDGTYRFTTISDDGVRVYIDNQLVIDEWNDHGATTHTGEKTLTAGDHEIKVEFYDNYVDAVAKFSFEKLGGTPPPPPPPPSGQQTITFDDIAGQDQVLSGEYPTGIIDWATNIWWHSAPWNLFTTKSVTFNGPDITSGTFTFLTPKKLIKIDAYNGGASEMTITLQCSGNPDKQQVLSINQVVTIDTGWANACTSVTLSSTNGWDTNFDNIVIE